MSMVRNAVLLVYCAAIAAGAYLLCTPIDPEAREFETARAMAVNHVVQAGDLRAREEGEAADLTQLDGLFAKSEIRLGQIVRPGDFAPVPLLHVPNKTIVALPVRGSVPGANAGSPFTLCEAKKPPRTVEAAALLCDGTGDERKNCTILSALSLQEAREVLALLPGAVVSLEASGCTPPEEVPDTESATRPQRPPRRR